MILGLDYRPALLSPTGISRVVRELVPRLAGRPEIDRVALLGHSLAPASCRPPRLPLGVDLHRLPIPGRLLPALHRLGLGADTLCGGCHAFLHTDFVYPPLRRARPLMILHDLAYMVRPAWHGDNAAGLTARVRRAADRAELILVPSPAVQEQVAELLPGAAARTVLLPWGGDHAPALARPDLVPPHLRPRAGEGPLLVAVGRVEPRKGHRLLLDAFAGLRRREPRATLVVAGPPGWADPALLDRLRRLHQETDSGVRWEQDLADPVLLGLVSLADLLVYPSEYEGFGLPVLEALALGTRPVVAAGTACAWVAGPAGLTFADGESGDLTDLLARELARPAGAAERQACRQRAAAFTWEETARRLAEVLA